MNASRPSSYGFYPRQPLVTKPPVKKSTVGGYVKLFAVIILAAGLIYRAIGRPELMPGAGKPGSMGMISAG